MSLIPRALLASTLLLVTFVTLVTPSYAQEGGVGGGPSREGGRGGGRGGRSGDRPSSISSHFPRNVVLERTSGLSEWMMRLVVSELNRNLRTNSVELGPARVQSISLMSPEEGGGGGVGDSESLLVRSLGVQMELPVELPGDVDDLELLARGWDEVRKRLQAALRSAQRRMTQQMIQDQIRNLRSVAEKLAQTQDELVRTSGEIEEYSSIGSPEQLRNQLESARDTLSRLALDRVSAEARREAIVARIDELREAGTKASADDPLVAELEKLVDIREQQLQHVRELQTVESMGGVGPLLQEAETEMAKARVELLKSKRAAMADAAGGVVQELNNELSRLIVQLAEIDARSKALQQQVAELQQANSVSNTTRAEQLSQKLVVLQRRVAELEEAKAQLDSQAPPAAEEITITPLDEALSLGGEIEDDGNAAQSDH